MRVTVTEIAWDGSIRRRALDTARLADPGRWENLIGSLQHLVTAILAAGDPA